jgi:hypothetical protein
VATSSTTCNHLGGSEFKSASGSTTACNGKDGQPGPEGSPWTAGGTLPKGATETGAYVFGPNLESEIFSRAQISFPIPLASGVQFKRIEFEGTSPAECPGSRENPKAAEGFLCVYEGPGGGAEFETWLNPENSETEEVGKVGVLLKFGVLADNAKGYGVWAVTAP